MRVGEAACKLRIEKLVAHDPRRRDLARQPDADHDEDEDEDGQRTGQHLGPRDPASGCGRACGPGFRSFHRLIHRANIPALGQEPAQLAGYDRSALSGASVSLTFCSSSAIRCASETFRSDSSEITVE